MAFWIFQGMLNFSSYEDFFNFGKLFSDILKVCMKYFKRAKDNIAASTTTIKNEAEMDEKEEKEKISTELLTIQSINLWLFELFDCSPLKNAKLDRTL